LDLCSSGYLYVWFVSTRAKAVGWKDSSKEASCELRDYLCKFQIKEMCFVVFYCNLMSLRCLLVATYNVYDVFLSLLLLKFTN